MNMKRIISIVIISLVFAGCSSNSEEQPIDSIVGLWNLKSITAMGQEFINDCKSKDKLELRADKTFTITSHNEDSNCASQSSSGSWASDTSNRYKFTSLGDTQIFTLTSDTSLTFSFVQDSNTIVYSFKKE